MSVRLRKLRIENLPTVFTERPRLDAAARDWGSVPRQVDAIVDGEGSSRLLILCAEPCMGKSAIIAHILDLGKDRGFATHRLAFSSSSPEAAARRITRASSDVRAELHSGHKVLLCIDDIPPSDEAIVAREARAIARMVSGGAFVIVSMLPEAKQLAYALDGGYLLTAQEMLECWVLELKPRDALYPIKARTNGIPTLVRALASMVNDIERHGGDLALNCPAYADLLPAYVAGTLRRSLLDKEVALRLALILLGCGRMEDVEDIVGGISQEALEPLLADVPLFAINLEESTFFCAGVFDEAGLALCSGVIAPLGADFPETFASAAEVLVMRGDIKRAALVARMCTTDQTLAVVASEGTRFINAGEGGLVLDSLIPARSLEGISTETGSAVSAALAAVGDRKLRFVQQDETWALSSQRLLVEADLLCRCRLALRSGDVTAPVLDGETSELAAALSTHLQALILMRDGHPSASLRALASHVAFREDMTLATAMLRLDQDLARLLLCDETAGMEESSYRAREFLARDDFDGINMVSELFDAIAQTLWGTPDPALVERVAREGERSGNELIRVTALLIGMLNDFVAGENTRVRVAAAVVGHAADMASLTYISEVAWLLDQMAAAQLGELSALSSIKEIGLSGGLAAISAIAINALEDQDGPLAYDFSLLPAPIDCFWLLRSLLSGCGAFFDRFRALTPKSWINATKYSNLPQKGGPTRSAGQATSSVPRLSGEPHGPALVRETSDIGRKRVEIRLMGSFSVTVDGRPVPEESIAQRNGKSMLVFLALSDNFRARRYEIIEEIFPGVDYESGLNRVYQATAAIRRAIGSLADNVDPFLSSRGDRSVALNPALVSCDVDDFEHLARTTLDIDSDDERVVKLARCAEELYAGDLFVPRIDATGYIVARREGLRELFADVMVAGAEAAMRLKRYRVAARLADEALSVDALREDALLALLPALNAAGRRFEAEQRYRRYALEYSNRTHTPPSRQLRLKASGALRGELAEVAQ